MLSPSDQDHIDWLNNYHSAPLALKSILDIGCGEGNISSEFSSLGVQSYTGIDICLEDKTLGPVRLLKKDLNDPNWFEAMPSFDLVLAFDILEHLDSPWTLLGQIHKVLKDDGSFILTTPNTQSWERVLRPKTWSGAANHEHKQLFSPYSLKFLLEKAGFRVLKMECPIRRLGQLNRVLPKIGGQIYCEAKKQLCS